MTAQHTAFHWYTAGIALATLLAMGWVMYRYRDPFHPLVYLGPMVLFIYVVLPWRLDGDGVLQSLFAPDDLLFAQRLNLVAIGSLLIGATIGSRTPLSLRGVRATIQNPRILRNVGIAFGLVSVATYVYNIYNVGGLAEAYGVPKGGGTASSGYLRDFFYLAIPGITLVMIARRSFRRAFDYVWIALFASPFLLHGLLATRRGPTFAIAVTLAVAWYLSRGKRPRLALVLLGGVGLGFLLLTLVTVRPDVYLGSPRFASHDWSVGGMLTSVDRHLSQNVYGNEFVYGTTVVTAVREADQYYWGARYATVLFITPIPSQIWPSKYEDVGMGALRANVGLPYGLGTDRRPPAPIGAAPGFVADLYAEFSWGAILAAGILGWLFAVCWARALAVGGVWTPVYVIVAASSIHLIAQTFIAMLHAVLIMLVPTLVAGRMLYGRSRNGDAYFDNVESTLSAGPTEAGW